MTIDDVIAFHQHLKYNKKTGTFSWRVNKRGPNCKVGAPVATYVMPNGYLRVGINGKRYYAHRVAFAMHYKRPLKKGEYIDHINGDRTDNRAVNLRVTDMSGNIGNKTVMIENRTGYPWVKIDRPNVYSAVFSIQSKLYYISVSSDPFDVFYRACVKYQEVRGWIPFCCYSILPPDVRSNFSIASYEGYIP